MIRSSISLRPAKTRTLVDSSESDDEMDETVTFACQTERSCDICRVRDTPMWRRGPRGLILCNKCAIRWKRKTKMEEIAAVILTKLREAT